MKCPTCRRETAWSADNAFRPFCSERCKLVDLGAWFTDRHAIPGDAAQGENDTALPDADQRDGDA